MHRPVVVEAELGEQQRLPLVLRHVGQLGGGRPAVVGQGAAHTVLGQHVRGPGVAAHWTNEGSTIKYKYPQTLTADVVDLHLPGEAPAVLAQGQGGHGPGAGVLPSTGSPGLGQQLAVRAVIPTVRAATSTLG